VGYPDDAVVTPWRHGECHLLIGQVWVLDGGEPDSWRSRSTISSPLAAELILGPVRQIGEMEVGE
jgi:hypothetical protein